MTAVLFGTAAIWSTGQSKSEPFKNCTTFPKSPIMSWGEHRNGQQQKVLC